MKKWYYWLLLAAIWCVAGIVNYFDGRTNYYLFQIVIFLLLAPCQLICEKYDDKGRKVFKYICIGMILLCVVYLALIIYITLN